jgi:hypothetical protein
MLTVLQDISMFQFLLQSPMSHYHSLYKQGLLYELEIVTTPLYTSQCPNYVRPNIASFLLVTSNLSLKRSGIITSWKGTLAPARHTFGKLAIFCIISLTRLWKHSGQFLTLAWLCKIQYFSHMWLKICSTWLQELWSLNPGWISGNIS